MIKKYRLELEVANNNLKPSPSWAYLLYATMIENIKTEYVEYLHEDGLNPINQYVHIPDRNCPNKIEWNINLLGNEAISQVEPFLMKIENIRLKKFDTDITVTNRVITCTTTEADILNTYLTTGNAFKNMRIDFLSATSFKSNEKYVLFPSVDLILKSAVSKWNAFSSSYALDDEEALQQMIDRTRIYQYALRSNSFMLKQARIPGFRGYIKLYSTGPDPMVRLINLLFGFLEYSGVGIKTTLGMGGCKVTLEGE
ncbi:MAG: CRISPR system precrRNA processing endoribonuclease RAMP protein Cas6 [Clostridiales bacterium]|nr:CRISPR system precrRNA processing endoribonuclease RAMP protein Cas6 [Clostridiales bacterium]